MKTTLIRGGLSIYLLHCSLEKEACRNKSSQVQELFIGSQSQRVNFLLCHALNIISF